MSETTTRPVRRYHHGRTPAGWVGTVVAFMGFAVGSYAFMVGPDWTLVSVAGGIVVLSLILTVVLRGLGFGQA